MIGLAFMFALGRPSLARLPSLRHRFVVIAHRGDHEVAPENTVAAIQDAIHHDVDFAEIDLRMSKDGHIVIMHDGTVDRTTDGKGKVEDITLEEFQKLRTRDPHTKELTENHAPSLEEVFAAAKGHINLYLDIKAVTPEQVKPYLDKFGMRRSVIAYVYGSEQFREWKNALPDVPIIADVEGESHTPEASTAWWQKTPCEILDGPFLTHSAEEVRALQALGAKVWPDIENPGENPAQWDIALATGVTGLQTDHPKELIAYLKSKGLR